MSGGLVKMKKKYLRIIAVVLSVVMLTFIAPVSFSGALSLKASAAAAPTAVCETAVDASSKRLYVTVKINNASGFNAGNFTLTYGDSVTPVSSEAVKPAEGDDMTVINYSGKEIKIAVLFTESAVCASDGSYTICVIPFNISGQADTASVKLVTTKFMANGAVASLSDFNKTDISLHNYIASVEKVATCSVAGKVVYTCSICGKTYTEEKTDPDNHVGETEIRNEKTATCVEDGYTGDVCCKDCGAVITKGTVISKNTANHVGETEIRNAVETSCKKGSKPGYTGDVYCKACGKLISTGTVIPVPDHTYVEVVTPPTCTEIGYTTYTCSVCGDTYNGNIVRALGHDYDENGVCRRCGEREDGASGISLISGSVLTLDSTNKTIVSKNVITVDDFKKQLSGSADTYTIVDKDGKAVATNIPTGAVLSCSGSSEKYTVIIMYDVNADGKVNSSDARLALRYSAKIEALSDNQLLSADADGNGKVNAADARKILRVSAKLE